MQLFLFTTSEVLVREATAAGIDGFVVDWEHRDKARRQSGADTEINEDTVDDLALVRRSTSRTVLCRLNSFGEWTRAEIEAAVGCGADEVLLPMVRSTHEVERVLELARNRLKVGILIETADAAQQPGCFAKLPLSRVYIGLNDLTIDRGDPNIFVPLVDGTVDRIAGALNVAVGVGGLTHPGRGAPVPARLLAAELVRVGASFTFLRRSFKRDLGDAHPASMLQAIRDEVDAAQLRSAAQRAEMRAEFLDVVTALDGVGVTV